MSNRLEALQALARKLRRFYAWGRVLDLTPARDESIERITFKLGLKGLLPQKSLGARENLKRFWTRDLIRENSHKWVVGGLREFSFHHSRVQFGEKELRLLSSKGKERVSNSRIRDFRARVSGQAGGFHNNLLGIFREGTATRVGNSFWSNSLGKVLKESSMTRLRVLATSSESFRRSSPRLDKVFERVNSFGLLSGEEAHASKQETGIFSSSTMSRIASLIKNSRVQSSIDNRKVIHIANLTIENANISDLETFKMELASIVGD